MLALKVAQLDDQPVHAEKDAEQQADHGERRRGMEIFVGIIAEQRAAKNRGEKFDADGGEAPEADGRSRFGWHREATVWLIESVGTWGNCSEAKAASRTAYLRTKRVGQPARLADDALTDSYCASAALVFACMSRF